MKSKYKPTIQANNQYIPRDEYRLCKGHACRNAVASWVRFGFCSRCRKGRSSDRS